MKIVIDISKDDFEKIKNISFVEDTETMLHQSSEDRKSTMMLFRVMDAIKEGTPLSEHHGDLIDRTKLYNQTSEWEAQALEQVNRYNPEDSIDEWRWWSAVLKERGVFKHDVADAPTIIEGSDTE